MSQSPKPENSENKIWAQTHPKNPKRNLTLTTLPPPSHHLQKTYHHQKNPSWPRIKKTTDASTTAMDAAEYRPARFQLSPPRSCQSRSHEQPEREQKTKNMFGTTFVRVCYFIFTISHHVKNCT